MKLPSTPTCWAALLLLLLPIAGCVGGRDKVKIAGLSTELADRLTQGPPPAPSDVASQRQRIYVDSTLSMQGFVGKAAGARTSFDEFIDAMPDVLSGSEIWRYGQATREGAPNLSLSDVTTRAEFDAQLHNRTTYNLFFNPDDILISNIAAQPEPVMSVLLTDGVESDARGQVNTVVVDSIRTWLDRGNLFAILMMKSRFSGPFYSERLRRTLKQDVNVEARPFYAFVFATSRREFADLTERLRRRFPELGVIEFSDDALDCRVEMPLDNPANYANEAPPAKPYYWQMLDLKGRGDDARDQLIYRYAYEVKGSYPVKVLGFRLKAALRAWDGGQRLFQEPERELSADLNVESDGGRGDPSKQNFLLRPAPLFAAAGPGDYQFYSFEPSVYVKEPSDEVMNLSTRDDSTPETANRTYRFQELVLAVVDVHLKDRLLPRASPRVYLTVANI